MISLSFILRDTIIPTLDALPLLIILLPPLVRASSSCNPRALASFVSLYLSSSCLATITFQFKHPGLPEWRFTYNK